MSEKDRTQDVSEALDLIDCQTLVFCVRNDVDAPARIQDVRDYRIECSADRSFNREEQLVRVVLNVGIAVETEETDPPRKSRIGGELVMEAIFHVSGIEDWLQKKRGKTVLDPSISVSAVSIAYSIARGVLLTRSSGTILEFALLPVINPAVLMNNN